MLKETKAKFVGKFGNLIVASVDPFTGRKNILTCQGNGKDDSNCLEQNHPEGYFMIDGHICGAGVSCRGSCQAVFTRPEDNPDLFTYQPELLSRIVKK
jgi:hypothetical protein